MCGIAGVVGPTGPGGREQVARMCSALHHRGPDASGAFDADGVHLGMRRLSIIDVSGGDQPFRSEDGRVVAVFNGEIYNHAELRDRLRARGHRLVTTSDTEVTPHLYEEHGADFVTRLSGMFGIAVWDDRERTLVLARDRVGKKPLFYAEHDGALWFGSELKSLLATGVLPLEIDPVALDLYLTYQYVPHPWTIFRGIHKVPPGHTLTWRDGRVAVRRYWEPEYAPAGSSPGVPDAELAEQLRAHLLRATRIRMPSERPLGAFLSGGLDSAAVVAAMAQQSTQPVKTFAIGFTDERFDELPHARRVAQLFGTEHHEQIVHPDIEGVLPVIARAFDEPFADASAVPSYYVAQLARENVVVTLTGDGGDESFGGYTRYPHALGLPGEPPAVAARILRRAGRALDAHGNGRLSRRAVKALRLAAEGSGPAAYARLMSYFEAEQRQRIYTPEARAEIGDWDSDSIIQHEWARLSATDPVNRLLGVDVATYLPGDLLPKVDITTMAHSLEARSPLLDTDLMQWAAALPGGRKVSGRKTKVLMKAALRPWLPNDLIDRPKQGFGIPREEWLAGPLRQMCQDLLTTETPVSQRFDAREVDSLLTPGIPDGSQGRRLWALLMLQLWWCEVPGRSDSREPVIRLPDVPAEPSGSRP